MEPPKFFLSYSREDLKDIEIIAQTLMLHGIRIWQDIKNLGTGLSENKIKEAIQKDCSGLLFYSTQASIQSPMILNVELPEAERKHKKDQSFHILPIFKLAISETDSALKGHLMIPISNFNGVKVEQKEKDNIILMAAQKAAEIILNENKPIKIATLPIGLASKQKTSAVVFLDIDFTPFFSKGLPTQKTWNEEFLYALTSIKNALVKKDLMHLRLYSFAHLSLGLLFGYIFRGRTGFRLEVEQISQSKREIWTTSATPEKNDIRINSFPGDLRNNNNLCVKINLISPDDNSVNTYIGKSGLSFRSFLELSPPNYPYIISGGQAIAIANQLAGGIKQMHAQYGTDTVHIFAAIPLGLALFIGYNLNACGRIQCYEFDNLSREYFPSCIINSA